MRLVLPTMPSTWSCSISFRASEAICCGSICSSSAMYWIGRPLIPPLSLTQSKYAFVRLVIQVKSATGALVAIAPILIGSPVAFSPVPMPHSPGFWMLLAPPLDAAVVGVPLAAVVGVPAAVVGAAAAVVGAAAAVVGAAAAVVGVPPAAVVAPPPLSSSSPHAAIKSTLIAASPRSERFMSLSPLQVSPYVSPDVLAAKYTADGRL